MRLARAHVTFFTRTFETGHPSTMNRPHDRVALALAEPAAELADSAYARSRTLTTSISAREAIRAPLPMSQTRAYTALSSHHHIDSFAGDEISSRHPYLGPRPTSYSMSLGLLQLVVPDRQTVMQVRPARAADLHCLRDQIRALVTLRRRPSPAAVALAKRSDPGRLAVLRRGRRLSRAFLNNVSDWVLAPFFTGTSVAVALGG
jgi:hypothetical protein